MTGTTPKPDGRQSATALAVQRGVLRHLAAHGWVGITEFALASGRRADVLAIDGRGEIAIIEIKSSLQDFRSDGKWPEYRAFCDRLLFAVPADFPVEVLPQDVGLLLADGFGAAQMREAPRHPLAPATRKALTLRLARAAASRLTALHDPALLRQDL
ncbi:MULTISPECIES: MmcB family DNA repair protein [unclassified Xanthobacter]|uniref:MmcB family DNA repair protein n=1 Tax=unclassified Xanthobacter TaxID=2623496 RepID=UPI001EDE46E4|nr:MULTISPECIES: MmcB family DNA repair protein [unclassified Xanthobacter]